MSAQPATLGLTPMHPGWGEDYQHGQVAYVTTDGIAVWMYRKGCRVRFYDSRGVQHGPEHANVVPAIVWAGANAWLDPASPMLSLAVIAEVRRGGAQPIEYRPEALRSDKEAGAWIGGRA